MSFINKLDFTACLGCKYLFIAHSLTLLLFIAFSKLYIISSKLVHCIYILHDGPSPTHGWFVETDSSWVHLDLRNYWRQNHVLCLPDWLLAGVWENSAGDKCTSLKWTMAPPPLFLFSWWKCIFPATKQLFMKSGQGISKKIEQRRWNWAIYSGCKGQESEILVKTNLSVS